MQVGTETGRNLDGQRHMPAAQIGDQHHGIGQIGITPEIRRAGEFIDIGAALRRLVAVEHGEGDVIDIEGDRKSVVKGKSVSVRVDLGGRRIIKTKTERIPNKNASTNRKTNLSK